MTRSRRIGALLVALALLGACSGGGDDSRRVSSSDDRGATTTGAVDDAEETTTTGGPDATTATTSGKTVAPGTGGAATKPGGSAASGEAPPGPAQVGTYTYAQSGTTPDGPVPPSGTLVVAGGSTQSFKRYYDPNRSPQTLTFAFRDDGPFLTAAALSARGFTITCNFAAPVALPPWPPVPGKTFSGSATCTNGISATINGSVTSRNGDLVGIAATIKATGSGINVTVEDNESWSISLRVPKTSRQTYSGTTPIGPVSGDVSSTLTASP